MAKFPDKEADVQALAQTLLDALEDNFVGLQGAPVTAAEFKLIFENFKAKSYEAMQAYALAKGLTVEKRAEMTKLKRAMRRTLRYAESRLSTPDLERIGWGERRARRMALKPGQPLELNIVKEGSDWISLRWKIDRTGGKARFYRIMRRGNNEGWHEVSSSLGTQYNLIEQPRGEQMEFCVVAVNTAGESVQSNSVHAVL